jgi:hypothetical protein
MGKFEPRPASSKREWRKVGFQDLALGLGLSLASLGLIVASIDVTGLLHRTLCLGGKP